MRFTTEPSLVLTKPGLNLSLLPVQIPLQEMVLLLELDWDELGLTEDPLHVMVHQSRFEQERSWNSVFLAWCPHNNLPNLVWIYVPRHVTWNEA